MLQQPSGTKDAILAPHGVKAPPHTSKVPIQRLLLMSCEASLPNSEVFGITKIFPGAPDLWEVLRNRKDKAKTERQSQD